MNNHGGRRKGAGRPAMPINMNRVMTRLADGSTKKQIAIDFGVGAWVISKAVLRLKAKPSPRLDDWLRPMPK